MYKISTNYSQNDHMTIIHTPRIEQELHVLAEQTRHLLHKVLLALSQTCKYVPLPGQEMLPLPTRAICAAVLCCLNVMIHHLLLGGWRSDVKWSEGNGWRKIKYLHVVLDELLDFIAGVFVLAVFDGAVLEFVVESCWAEQDDSPVNRQQKKWKRSFNKHLEESAELTSSLVWGRWFFFN